MKRATQGHRCIAHLPVGNSREMPSGFRPLVGPSGRVEDEPKVHRRIPQETPIETWLEAAASRWSESLYLAERE